MKWDTNQMYSMFVDERTDPVAISLKTQKRSDELRDNDLCTKGSDIALAVCGIFR